MRASVLLPLLALWAISGLALYLVNPDNAKLLISKVVVLAALIVVLGWLYWLARHRR